MGIITSIKKWLFKRINNLLIEMKPKPPYIIKELYNVKVGNESYHNGNLTIKGNGFVKIGNYCAFGQDIKIILSNHNYDFASIQYSFYKKNFNKLPYEEIKGNTSIGSDVWVGDNVVILPNVNIGNGVIIGAGSIVTKDIPDFAIVAGNPAKILKYRFNQEKIEELNESKWWNWSAEEIKKNDSFFFQNFNQLQ